MNMPPPSPGSKNKPSKKPTGSTWQAELMVEAEFFSTALADFQWTAHCYITEDRILHNSCSENLRSYTMQSRILYI
jgi:hypothetical protein